MQRLTDIIEEIKGTGSFLVSGKENLIIPGLRIAEYGEVSFPIEPEQVKGIIGAAHKAPFGKGSRTVYDDTVRSAWEIDAGSISFHNPEWPLFLDNIINEVKTGLGIEEENPIAANLYKLLIYEQGDFFLPHKDSEKEKGMFGTLIVGLPSAHKGGELIINFDGRSSTVDFSEAGNYTLPFTAFFADCEHEVKPITSGYRICLVYNLISSGAGSGIKSPEYGHLQQEMVALLKSGESAFDNMPKAVLLSHEYTPANFSLESLKGHDKPRTKALLNAAEKAGYMARLALVTHHKSGELDSDDDYSYNYGYGRYKEEPKGDSTMGEVYEEYTYIEHWDGHPNLGNLSIKQEDVLSDLKLGEGEPSEQEEEGYTGNAGMTIDYWYHYGAVILWPASKHSTILKNRPIEDQLRWLNYYVEDSKTGMTDHTEIIKELVLGIAEQDYNNGRYGHKDFSSLAKALCYCDNRAIVHKLNGVLINVFDSIKVEHWIALVNCYDLDTFRGIFSTVGHTKELFKIAHLLQVLKGISLQQKVDSDSLFLGQIDQIPQYLNTDDIHTIRESYSYYGENPVGRVETTLQLVQDVLTLSIYKEDDTSWIQNTAAQLTKSLKRTYLNKILIPVLLKPESRTPLFYALKEICAAELSRKTKEEPQPLENWTRKIPESKNYASVWKMLTPFLNSPVDSVYDYKAKQQAREAVENAIKGVTIDLKTETIKKGSPHILRLTKTQSEFERLHTYWREDMEFLKKLEGLG